MVDYLSWTGWGIGLAAAEFKWLGGLVSATKIQDLSVVGWAAPVQHVSQEGQLDSLRFLKAINPEKFADGVRQKPTPLAKMMGSP